MRPPVRRIVVELLAAALACALFWWAWRADDVWFDTHWFAHYCPVQDNALSHAHVARGVAAVLGVLVVVVFRPWMTRWASRVSFRDVWPTALAVVLSVVVTEAVLRYRNARKSRAAPPPTEALLYRNAQTLSADVGGRRMVYVLNTLGVRARTENDVPDFHAPTILFSGESVLLGYGLDYEETIPALVQAHTGIQTVNLAISGCPQDWALNRLVEWLPRFDKPVAVVSFVVHTWMSRNVDPGRPRLAPDGQGHLVTVPPTSEFWRKSPLLEFFGDVVQVHDGSAVDTTRALLRETASVARARGAHPLFVVTQCGPRCVVRPGESPWIAKRLVEGLDAQTIETNFEPSLELTHDMHPNPEGARQYAAAIERALQQAGVVGAK